MNLTQNELTEIHKLLIRLNRIVQACVEQKISIMVDAEQTYFQTAINYLATELQRYYNKNNNAYIYGTYQCYLKVNICSIKILF
jgi:proline dehydrogenase